MPRPKKEPTWLAAILWFVCGVGLLIAVNAGLILRDSQQQAEWNAGTGSVLVELAGTMAGDSYSLSPLATAMTDAEHRETTLEVSASRIETQWNSRTPIVVVRFSQADLTCSTARSWIWSSDAGSTLTLQCDRYVVLEEMSELGAGSVESG